MKHTFYLLALVCMLALLSPSAATAQNADSQTTPGQAAADQFVRGALDLLASQQTQDPQYRERLAATLLDQALALDPDNAQVWKLRVDLAEQSGDSEAYEKALLSYLRTGVKDDQAQLSLLTHRLSQRNTLDEQYQAVTKLLESQGAQRLSAPLRSRLSSFAAATAAELVQPDDYAKWAVQAARLDPTNQEAAEMLLGIVVERGGDVVKQGSGIIGLVRAQPLDPGPRVQLAGVLASQALFDRAAQQYQVAGTRLSNQPLPLDAYRNWAHCLVIVGEGIVALQLIEQLESALQGDQNQGDADEQPEQDAPAMLPLDMEVLRLSTLDSETDTDAAAASFARIRQTVGMNKDAAGAAEQLAIIAAVLGPDLDEATELAAALPEDSEQRDVALGWVAVRKNDMQRAVNLLEPLVEDHSLAKAGFAIASGLDEPGRARELRRVIQIAPNSLAAVAAAKRLNEAGERIDPTREGQALADLMSRFSEALWLVDVERSPWLDARMQILPGRFKQAEPIQAEITVWNTTRFPLAIGEDRPIRPRALVLLRSTAAGQPIPQIPPVVIDLNRTLVLQPGERLTFDTRLDYSQFGSLVAANPGIGITFDARLVVNPLLSANGAWLPAGVGGISIVRDSMIQSGATNPANIEIWLQELAGNDVAAKTRAISRLAMLNPEANPQAIDAGMQRRVRDALIEAWPKLNQTEQAWLVGSAFNLDSPNAPLAPLVEQIKQSDSKAVWLAYLSQQIADGDSEMLREAIRRQDMIEVARFAEALRRMLRETPAAPAQQPAEQPTP